MKTALYILRLVAATFVLLVLQGTLVPRLEFAGIAPDLLLGAVFRVAVRRSQAWGLWVAVLLGLLVDLEQPARLGLSSLGYVLAVIAIDRGSRALDRTSPIVLFIVLFGAGMITESLRSAWLADWAPWKGTGFFFRFGLPSAFYTAIVLAAGSWIVNQLLGKRTGVLDAT